MRPALKGSLVALGVALAIPAAARAQNAFGITAYILAQPPTGTAQDATLLATACRVAQTEGASAVFLLGGTYNGTGILPAACAGIGSIGPGVVAGSNALLPLVPSLVGAVPVTASTCSGTQVLTFPARGRAVFDVTLGAACAYTFAGGVAGAEQRVTLYERQPSTGSTTYTGTFPNSVKFAGGAPAQATGVGQVRIVTFATDDGGATVFGGL